MSAMTTRTKVLLTALVWLVAAGLCVLYALWPPYRHFYATHQWQFGVALGGLLGWTSNDIIKRRRR